MKFINDNKSTFTLAVIVVLVLFVYSMFFSTPNIDTTTATNAGEDLVKISNNLSKATLGRELFNQTSYKLLNDFSTPLTPEASGRSNPFAPIGQ